MNNNLNRSLNDIQMQADHIINSNPSLSQVKSFEHYSNELKKYIIEHAPHPEAIARLEEIPEIIDSSPTKGCFPLFFFGSFNFYFHEQREIEYAKVKIARIKSIYASIDFILRKEI